MRVCVCVCVCVCINSIFYDSILIEFTDMTEKIRGFFRQK